MAGRSPKRWGRAGILGAAALWALGCQAMPPNVGTTAASMMDHIRDTNDPNVRYTAYGKLSSSRVFEDENQKIEVVKLLSSNLLKDREPSASRAVICHTLGELHRQEARQALTHAASDPRPLVRAAACRALGKCGLAGDCTLLARIMAVDEDKDVQIAAIEGLAALKAPDSRIDTVLLDGMESPDPAFRLASYDALCDITEQDFGQNPKDWKNFLAERAKVLETAAKK